MKFQDTLQETYTALSANKARSGLTILGIVIGIGSVIAMVSIGQGASGQITSSIEGLGSNLLTVSPGVAQQGSGFVSAGRGSAQTLKNDDVDVIRQIAGVAYISPERQGRYQIVAAGNNTNSTVIGVSPEYAMVRNISVADGSFITEANMRSLGRVAVLGPTVAQDASLALADKHRVDPASPDFSILSQSDILGTLTQVTDTFTIFLAAVAGISLIVGGIGIMNMMLTTVTERTREIGLRKAIGAKSRHISRQFLTEAIMLTFLGGAVGVALGWIISILVSRFAGIATTVSMSSV